MQDEPLSPFLFLMYINDLYDCMNDDINVNTDELSIFLLLFDDDLMLISKTSDAL